MNTEESMAFWKGLLQEDRQKMSAPAESGVFQQNTGKVDEKKQITGGQLGSQPINQIQIHLSRMEDNVDNKGLWNQRDEDLLFLLHREQGNKWSTIAIQIPSRTESCVKNKFYSTLRKGFRKVNKYISSIRKKSHPLECSNNKQLKSDFLTKLTAIADRNYEQKYEVKAIALELSQSVQSEIIEIARNMREYQKNQIDDDYRVEQDLLRKIFQFRKNCKRRKGKKKATTQDHNSQKDGQSSIVEEEAEQQVQQLIQFTQKDEEKIIQPLKINAEVKQALQKSILFEHPQRDFKQEKQDFKEEKEENIMEEAPQIALKNGVSELFIPPHLYPQDIQMTPYQLLNSKNFMSHMTEASPFASMSNSRFFTTSSSFIESLKMVDVSSAHPSNASDINKSMQMAFIEKIPVLNESKDGVQFFKSSQLSKVNESNNIFIEVRNEKKLCISEMLIENKEGTICPQLLKGESFQSSTILTSTCFDSKRLTKGAAEQFKEDDSK